MLHQQKAPEAQGATPLWASCAGQRPQGIAVGSEPQDLMIHRVAVLAVRVSLLFQGNMEGILGQCSHNPPRAVGGFAKSREGKPRTWLFSL